LIETLRETTVESWHDRIGRQRDWVWRGWQTRYSYLRVKKPENLGNNPNAPLILLHGFGACIEHWRKNVPVLSQKRDVYAIDLLGFGGSRKAIANYSVDLWVEQVYDFWQIFIDRPVVLVGNSLGSLVSLVAAARHPDMVKGLAISSLPDVSLRQEMMPKFIAPMVNAIESFFASPFLLNNLLKIIRRRNFIRSVGLNFAYSDKSTITDELVEIIARPPLDEGAGDTLCALFDSTRQTNFAPAVGSILPDLDLPILLIWGKEDRVIPPIIAPIFAKMNHRVKLIEIENVGHCPHDEVPEKYNQILLDWLEHEVDRAIE
jgi:pimeloyl-ACP methyl ester carboxylesterase